MLLKCKKNSECSSAAPPLSLFFLIKENNDTLPLSILESVKMSYIVGGKKNYIYYLGPAIDYYANEGILVTNSIAELITQNDIQTFFLEYPNSNTVDTLNIQCFPPTENTGCQFKWGNIKFNGQSAQIDTSFKYQPVYIFNKR